MKIDTCTTCTAVEHGMPAHVVHPVTGDAGLYDTRGHAMCPVCGAQWHRPRNVATVVGRYTEAEREAAQAAAEGIQAALYGPVLRSTAAQAVAHQRMLEAL